MSQAGTEAVRAGLVVAVSVEDNTNTSGPKVFTARQIPTVNSLPAIVPASANARKEIDWSFGPVKVVGYVVTNTLEIGAEIDVFGAKVLQVFGNLKDGVVGKIDLFLAKGEIKFFLKNGKEVWVHLHLDVTFDGKFDHDQKLFDL